MTKNELIKALQYYDNLGDLSVYIEGNGSEYGDSNDELGISGVSLFSDDDGKQYLLIGNKSDSDW